MFEHQLYLQVSFTDCKESGCKTQPQALTRKRVKLIEHFEKRSVGVVRRKIRSQTFDGFCQCCSCDHQTVRKSPIVPLWLERSSATLLPETTSLNIMKFT